MTGISKDWDYWYRQGLEDFLLFATHMTPQQEREKFKEMSGGIIV